MQRLAQMLSSIRSQSHHSGIERCDICGWTLQGLQSPNRTTVGLKEHLLVDEDAEDAGPNRTTVGLKVCAPSWENRAIYPRPNRTTVGLKVQPDGDKATVVDWSQSHHSGIERLGLNPSTLKASASQSHHSGIERCRLAPSTWGRCSVPIAPQWD